MPLPRHPHAHEDARVTCLTGIHAVREALRAGRPLDRIVIARGRHPSRLDEIVRLARERGIPVRFEDRRQLDRLAATREHQGVVALASSKASVELAELLAAAPPGLLVLLDGVEDPHNLGAIVRTALAAGAAGLAIPERRAAGFGETVERASAGALAHLPVARVKNLARCMEEIKQAGYWLIGLDERAEGSYTRMDFTGPVAIVLGGEGAGLHELTRKRCDFLVSIPSVGPVRSLNVSVAAGIVLFEVVRQRRAAAQASAPPSGSVS
jgi:23S rRNA (guanosine2251-2'-O)-methyltransferase